MKAAENYDIKCESRVCINILKDSHLYFGMFLCYDEYSIEKDEKNRECPKVCVNLQTDVR